MKMNFRKMLSGTYHNTPMSDLIANTGLQFITKKVRLEQKMLNGLHLNFTERILNSSPNGDEYELILPYYIEHAAKFVDPNSINLDAYDDYGLLVPKRINLGFVLEIDEDDIYKVRAREAMNICNGHWIPLPFFRIRPNDPKNPFHHGPESWCRGMLEECEPNDEGFTHVFTLAFDTRISTDNLEVKYSHLRPADATDSGSERFQCVSNEKDAAGFLTSELLNSWMYKLYKLPASKDERPGNNQLYRHLAIYHVLLKLLEETDAFPDGGVGLLKGSGSIDVGLIIDIGNSRTCGLICEKTRPYDNDQFDFTSARRLRLRNLSKPHLVSEEPFEMQLAFSEERFGNQAAEALEDSFRWPSLLRVGSEAIYLTSIFESADYQATFSSPKRYLWDKNPVKVPWCKVDRDGRMGFFNDTENRDSALFGAAEYITSEGRVIPENKALNLLGATESRYSRSSLMVMAIYELLLHALSQMNDPEFRRDMGNGTFQRVLKDIVLTCPTAMTLQEQHTLIQSAKDAVVLLQRTLGEDLNVDEIEVHPLAPSLDPAQENPNPWKMDEASCSQFAYLYGELVHKYASKKNLFFEINGKERAYPKAEGEDPQYEQSVNIASIDIGGGTTDLMICSYSHKPEADIPQVTPKPLFWEGFNIAGDELIKELIEVIVIPAYKKELEKAIPNSKEITTTLNRLFGPNAGGESAQERIFKKQFANQIAAPIAYTAIEHVVERNTENKMLRLKDLFEEYPRPENGLLDHIEKTCRYQVGNDNDFSIYDIEFQIETAQINRAVQNVLGTVLGQLSYLIAQFDCDVILLSGRPSRMPLVRQLLAQSMLFSPDKIVCLGDYRFGHWYPFANPNGYVNDPKSTVCVGALIAYLNQNGQLPGMNFNFQYLDKIASTAKYIGVLDASYERIKNDRILLSDEKDAGEFLFYGQPVPIGMRQLNSEEWISSPLYVFDFLGEEARKRVMGLNPKFPLKVQIQRYGEHGEFLQKDNLLIEDSNGDPFDARYFEFALRTSIKHQDHWRDTGSFITPIN